MYGDTKCPGFYLRRVTVKHIVPGACYCETYCPGCGVFKSLTSVTLLLL